MSLNSKGASEGLLAPAWRYWPLTLLLVGVLVASGYAAYKLTYSLTSAAQGANGITLSYYGLLVSVLGFSFTLWQLSQTKQAAVAASNAVKEAKSRIAIYDAIFESSRATSLLRETQRHIKAPNWESVVASYSSAREAIIRLIELPSLVASNDRDSLSLISADISSLCDRVNSGLIKNKVSIDRAKALSLCRDHEDVLIRIQMSLERGII